MSKSILAVLILLIIFSGVTAFFTGQDYFNSNCEAAENPPAITDEQAKKYLKSIHVLCFCNLSED